MKRRWRALRPYVIAPIGYFIARLIGITLRIEAVGYERYKELECGVILLAPPCPAITIEIAG